MSRDDVRHDPLALSWAIPDETGWSEAHAEDGYTIHIYSVTVDCPSCLGSGVLPNALDHEFVCPTCQGRGQWPELRHEIVPRDQLKRR